MSLRTRSVILLIAGSAVAVAAINILSPPVILRCLQARGDEDSRAWFEYLSFNRRNTEKPSVVLLGGSDARELLDMDLARRHFAARGVQFYNLGHASQNPILEAFQAASSLNIRENDLIWMDISPVDFITDSEPLITPILESPESYLLRLRVDNEGWSVKSLAEAALRSVFPWYRYRASLRSCVSDKELSSKTFERHLYGDMSEPRGATERKLAMFAKNRIGEGKTLDADNRNLRLLNLIAKKYGHKLRYLEIPRNPLYSLIIAPSYLKQHYTVMKELGLARLSERVAVKREDFFDFNHIRTRARLKYTQAFISLTETWVAAR